MKKKLRIGITLALKDATESVWTNGMKLNALYLARMLSKSKENYYVCILNTLDIDFSKNNLHFSEFDLLPLKDNYQDIDLLICLGAQVEKRYLQHFENDPNKRVIGYKCGNNYIISVEEVLFKPSGNFFDFETEFDEIWYVPQQHENNVGYYSTLYRTKAIVTPFLWDSTNIERSLVDIDNNHALGKFKRGRKYDPSRTQKTLGVLEPNLNIVKYCLIPTMIAEESYRTPIGKEKIEGMMITNGQEISKHKSFLSVIRTFDLYKDGKIWADSRYQTAFIVSQWLDIVISHQILNPLNYLYLDAAYMGFPVLHNAHLCKDVGYYYEGSDTVAASKKLNWILENHDSNLEKYEEDNKKALWKYSINNPEIIKTYDDLIFNLFNGGNDVLEYVPETNLYTIENIRKKPIKKGKKK
jgi:hypothetical protein